MISFFVHIILLTILLFIFARHEAEMTWMLILGVVVPLLIVVQICGLFLGSWNLLLYGVLLVSCLCKYFYLQRRKAIAVAAMHLVLVITVSWIGGKLVSTSLDEKVELKGKYPGDYWGE